MFANQEREVLVNIIMSGLEHSLAPIALREHLSFTKQQTAEMVSKIQSFSQISGCVLISTCNRTELYLSCSEEKNPGELLCQVSGSNHFPSKRGHCHCQRSRHYRCHFRDSLSFCHFCRKGDTSKGTPYFSANLRC